MKARRGGFPRNRQLALVAVLGAALAVLPAMASSETTPSISAYNEPGVYGKHLWMPATATIAAGGTVMFSNPSSEVPHGLKFTAGPATPSCSGLPAAASEEAGAYKWAGECSFGAPGTYTFICTVHPNEMKGTITVNASGTTTVTTTTAPPTTTTGATPVPPPESPLAGPASQALKLAKSQRGGSVHGMLDISKAGAGGRLEVDLLARSASLAKAKHSARVRVGHLSRGSLVAGKLSFAVKLNAKARRALHRRHRLTLTVKIVLRPKSAAALALTRTVVEHS